MSFNNSSNFSLTTISASNRAASSGESFKASTKSRRAALSRGSWLMASAIPAIGNPVDCKASANCCGVTGRRKPAMTLPKSRPSKPTVTSASNMSAACLELR